jgi:nucleoside 2-deoxyribosyltransferase
MIAYLAGPIDFDNPKSKVSQLRADVKDTLRLNGYWVFDPSTAWTAPVHYEAEGTVQQANYAIIDVADLVVAVLVKDVFTAGTILELAYTRTVHPMKDVFAVGDIGDRSVALADLEVVVYETIEEGLF